MTRKKIKRKSNPQGIPFLPLSWQAFIARRVIDGCGLFLLFVGLAFLASIISYNHMDPSLNTAAIDTVESVKNWLGRPGAYISDLLIQTLGLAGLVFAVVPGIWGFRLLKRQAVNPLWLRFPMMLASALLLAVALARVPSSEMMVHPYMGGSGGTLMLNALATPLGPIIPAYDHIVIATLFGIVGALALIYALAISRAEIRSAFETVWALTYTFFAFTCYAFTAFYGWVRHFGDPSYEIPKPKPIPARKPAQQKPIPEISEDEMQALNTQTYASPAKLVKPPKAGAQKKTSQSKLALGNNLEWEFPPVDLMQEPPEDAGDSNLDEDGLRQNAEVLQNVLSDFNVNGDIVSIHPGPVVTLYELEPAPGTKTARVIGLSDDIARSMSAVSVRSAVVPGRNVIGIEMPNNVRQTVYMREVMEMQAVEKSKAHLPLILGKDIGGAPIVADLAKMPHLLVAGTTGSGKSVAVNTMIMSLLYHLTPEQCRFIMIDPKMLELSVYDDIPHLLSPVVTEPGKAIVSLKWTVLEMENRYRSMAKLGVRNIEGYNSRLREAKKKGETLMRQVQTGFDPDTGKPIYEEQPMDMTELPYIVVIVDEFADLMLVAGKDVENAIQRLAQMARAAGIHLIMATQRPSVDVITGVIKANFPTRISFQVTSKIDSRTILGEGGAEQLLGMGDMLYMEPGGRIRRVHGPFVSDDEVESVVNFLKSQGEPDYIDDVTEGGDFGDSEMMGALFGEEGGEGGSSVDELYDKAVAIVARERKASTSFIQRHLQIGYNRAARIIEEMERQGVVTPATATGKRDVLVSDHSGEAA